MKLVLATVRQSHRLQLLQAGPVKLVHRAGAVGPKGGIRMALLS
jgi:hypothetical protein